MKKVITCLVALSLLLQTLTFSGCSHGENGIKILSGSKKTLARLEKATDKNGELEGNEHRAYVEAALDESEEIIEEMYGLTKEKARKYLTDNGCTVETEFDEDIYNSVKNAYKELGLENLSSGCAVTDLHGRLLSLYSGNPKKGDYKNYATEKTPPYSSFKPLCVYAPAIENGLANWSTVYPDSPVKKIESENGQTYDWPSNATGRYTNENTTVAEAVKTSLNTVAVRCMQTVGLDNSLSFLQDKFDLTLSYESKKAALNGNDDVFGNVALGYLYEGVSPVDMAGYYQAFANGGTYSKPHTVSRILNSDEKVIYEYKSEENRVLKDSTAYIMNRLLQNVTTAGATGEKARCDGVSVGGKTGTGDNGNWFVGFTPQYSCSVWHGTEITGNNCPNIFKKIVSGFDNKKAEDYPDCDGIQKAAYCADSGLLFSDNCRKVNMGYYTADNFPAVCDIHNQPQIEQ